MARLTRSAKFAELHDQINNDKETTISSNDLSSYQNRLNNVQDNLGNTQQNYFGGEQTTYTSPFGNTNYYQQPAQPTYQQPQYQEPVYSQPAQPTYQQPAQPTYVEPEQPVYQQPAQPQYQQPQYQEPTYQQPQYQEPVYQQPQAPVEQANKFEQDLNSYFDSFNSFDSAPAAKQPDPTDFNSYFEPSKQDQLDISLESLYNDVFKDTKDLEAQKVIERDRDSYLDRTLNDVNDWNQNKGLNTIDQIVDNSVNEVRHPEVEQQFVSQPQYQQPAQATYQQPQYQQPTQVEPEQPQVRFDSNQVLDADEEFNDSTSSVNTDDEFSNTVSMEITKIMDEITATPVVQPAQPVIEQTENSYEDINEVEPQEVQTQVTVEEEEKEVVEIKNYKEVEAEITRDTISETIPFVVNDKQDIVEDDEDEEEGSNTVLNVILIVLIIILVAVLGLIVFYILKTKGIL